MANADRLNTMDSRVAALEQQVEILQLSITQEQDRREADGIRWKTLVDAVSADRDRWQAEAESKHRSYKQLWRESHDGEDSRA